MTPGMVNGVRCIWPEVVHIEPAPPQRIGRKKQQACSRGHIAPRYSCGTCVLCHRATSLRYQAEHRDEINAKRRARAAAKRAAREPA